ncbi:MAG: methylglyoxal synthase [Acetivibrionales bacterium]|jgi:methylglyoxal synthase|nr:methylglyoxal synthase [Clostridiaceae bacterium]
MNIALIAHDTKKELMEAFCIAYKFILSKHKIFATGRTGAIIAESSGLEVFSLAYGSLGEQQIIARIAYNEMDLVIYFMDPDNVSESGLMEILTLCDQNNIPVATNLAAAEVMINGLQRGDFEWRDLIAR